MVVFFSQFIFFHLFLFFSQFKMHGLHDILPLMEYSHLLLFLILEHFTKCAYWENMLSFYYIIKMLSFHNID